jgi:hypothetical protein
MRVLWIWIGNLMEAILDSSAKDFLKFVGYFEDLSSVFNEFLASSKSIK